MSLTGTEKTIAWAGVWMPAWAMMAFMMFFLSWERVRIKTNSRSEAIETPKNFLASSIPVPLAWMVVPPVAPAPRAASMTWSVCP